MSMSHHRANPEIETLMIVPRDAIRSFGTRSLSVGLNAWFLLRSS